MKIKTKNNDDRVVKIFNNKNKISLEKLFNDYKGKNQTKEFAWDKSKGKEIW